MRRGTKEPPMTSATTAEQYPGITYVIPCCGAKLGTAAAARDIYVGQMFRHTLAAVMANAEQEEARVLILSAKYGLVELDTELEPYEQRMDRAGSITAEELTAQALALGIDWGSDVYAFLPRPYFTRLDSALRALDVYMQDVYEGVGGIGDQRHVNAVVASY